jgi:VWFA-related protein
MKKPADLAAQLSRKAAKDLAAARNEKLMACIRLTVLLAVCLLCPGQQQPPTFRAQTTLVEFTVAALDSKGNPVTDLKKEEITLTENGQSREVAFFHFDGGTAEPPPRTLPPGTFSNRADYTPGPPRNITAIVLDAINTRPGAPNPRDVPGDQITVRGLVLRYLRAIAPDTRVAVYRIGEQVTVLHDFTNDLAALRERISKYSVEALAQASGEDLEAEEAADIEMQFAKILAPAPQGDKAKIVSEALYGMRRVDSYYRQMVQDRRVSQTLASLEALGDHLAGIPGRKNLVWISVGTPMFTSTLDGWGRSHEPLVRRTAQRLASQGIALYPVAVRGLLPHFGPRQWATSDALARITGGRVTQNTNDLTQGVKAAAADMHGAYTVGFYATGRMDNQWRRLSVKVARPGVRITYRQGYLPEVVAPQPQDWSADEWRAVVYSPFGSTALHLDAVAELTSGAGSSTVTIVLQIAARDLHLRDRNGPMEANVEISMAEKLPADKYNLWRQQATLSMAGSQAKGTDTAVLRYQRRWDIDPSTTAIRLIVRDRFTARYGTLDVPVTQIPVGQQERAK